MDQLEAVVRSLRDAPRTKYFPTDSPYIVCNELPPHWRSNKSLGYPFLVLILLPVPDGTQVTISAGNETNSNGEVRNGTALIRKQIAKFPDLRFVGKSGRGKNFHVTISVHSSPMHIATISRAIKVTVDGPRAARRKKKMMESDVPTPPSSDTSVTSSTYFSQFRAPLNSYPLSSTSTLQSDESQSVKSEPSSSSVIVVNPARMAPTLWRPF
ncbi:hypothetical protein PMAYCL1PPCAC_28985 [Pristionchus mayeri]|uniref:Runt domain-containing protein n=1 Tax=Pristionchus mayeri TaxID=1317129 RepID=A0AAN5D9Y4_9BILA|nr:hypothetical protein PMAYCL1PPCAC_28985 [Pristionchus mayeri]